MVALSDIIHYHCVVNAFCQPMAQSEFQTPMTVRDACPCL
jgi:hypothetical protein